MTVNNVTIKPAEPGDDPGEIMLAMMARTSTLPEAAYPWPGFRQEVSCPRCGQICCPRFDLLRQAAEVYKDRCIALCTECGLKGHQDKQIIPFWIRSTGMTVAEIMQLVLDQEVKIE